MNSFNFVIAIILDAGMSACTQQADISASKATDATYKSHTTIKEVNAEGGKQLRSRARFTTPVLSRYPRRAGRHTTRSGLI